MTDLISLAGNSIKTSQAALAVIGNNIANSNTEGYVRQELDVRENLPTRSGTVYLGSGALATGVKRAYDSLVESSLRSSNSDLKAQGPIIELTNRIIDVLGDQNASLTPALDSFFASFRDLSLDPTSQLRRDVVLSESKGLVSRFNELGTQLKAIDSDSREALDYRVTEFNSLVEQLAVVNSKLGRQSKLESQPADLLNTRDKLLEDLSGLMRVSVSEQSNGEVIVSLGSDSNGLEILRRGEAKSIGVQYLTNTIPNRVELLLDPYGDPVNLSGVSGGEIGGFVTFRTTFLESAFEQVNSLAEIISNEVNKTLEKGMDLYGTTGTPMFEIPPSVEADTTFARSNISAGARILDGDNVKAHDLEMIFDQKNSRWLVTDKETKQTFAANSVNNFAINGLQITVSGRPVDGDVVSVRLYESQASNIRVKIDDARQIAAAELFGLSLNESNTGGAKASVSMFVPSSGLVLDSMQDLIVNNSHQSSAKMIGGSYLDASFSIPTGTKDLKLSMLGETDSQSEIQVFTKEGVHLFGSTNLTEDQIDAMLSAKNGFNTQASYSANYLNKEGGYLGNDWALGVQSQSILGLSSAGETEVKVEAQIFGNHLANHSNSGADSEELISQGDLLLNGKALTALDLAAGTTLRAVDIVNWLDANIDRLGLDLTASANNIITVSPEQIDLSSSQLEINGTSIALTSPIESLSSLTNSINSQVADTGVLAQINVNGQLVLRNTEGNEAETISFGGSAGVLRLTGDVRSSVQITANRAENDLSMKEVSLTRSASGKPNDLRILGFEETLYLNGALEEDLIVFTTGERTDGLQYFASYDIAEPDTLYQRDSITDVIFTGSNTYKLVDRATDTVLSERSWAIGIPIQYGSFSLIIEGQPQSGDVFSIDGNQTGLASNENAIRIAEIENARVFGKGQTAKESYLSILTSAGNASRRSLVAQEALEVVYQQALQTKDQSAGVNLDEEASDLLRFQQAYQASAKVMQMANQLFDSILRI